MKKVLKEKIYGEHGRRWHKSTGTNWINKNKDTIILVACLIFIAAVTYYAYPILVSD